MIEATVIAERYAGLEAQALGLAEAAGFAPTLVSIAARRPWSLLPARFWPDPVSAVGLAAAPKGLVIAAGGKAAAVAAAARRRGARAVAVQNPRLPLDRFDVVVAQRHDEIVGPNVVRLRTALHRATAARLEAARGLWTARLRPDDRPLLSVLVGGSNGRKRLEEPEGRALAQALAEIARRDGARVAVTPSRRTGAKVVEALRRAIEPVDGYVWDGSGENPYFGLLACADAIVVTEDSISMVSEAVATAAPVMVAALPGRSRRIGLFLDGLRQEGRIRDFAGELATWKVTPVDDTAWAGAEVRRRLGFPALA